jgi:hypothetical protein
MTEHRTKPTRRQRMKGERGIAMIMTGLLLVPMMMFAAFGVDMAAWYARISFLQKSADAAALAGTIWMPDSTKAETVASASLRANGIVDGQNHIDVTMRQGASSSRSLIVEILDSKAPNYFTSVFAGDQRLIRSAEAEYYLPLPLGSPLNYFGGDVTKNTTTPVTYTQPTYTVTWPTDFSNSNHPPTVVPCNIDSSSTSGLGQWTGTTASPTFSGGYTSGNPQCQWTVNYTTPGGNTSGNQQPPDYDYDQVGYPTVRRHVPTNVPCNVFHATPAANGEWVTTPNPNPHYDATTRFASGTGARQCTWPVRNTSGRPSFYNTTAPVNRTSTLACNVGYQSGDGHWPAGSGGWATGTLPGGSNPLRDHANGNRFCEWRAVVVVGSTSYTVDEPTPNQIESTESPGFWAQESGPGSVVANGDAFSAICTGNVNCGAPIKGNKQYRSTGYWYVIKAPAAGASTVTVSIYDGAYIANSLSLGAGDARLGDTVNFRTEYRVYKQTNPLDINSRVPVGSTTTGNQTYGSCWWDLTTEAAFKLQWRDLCVFTPSNGDTYLLNVRTLSPTANPNQGAGVNGYAVHARSNNNVGVQPAVYAYGDMGMYNNICENVTPACTSATATFYLAEVGAQYAGKILAVDLWDPGDANGNAVMYPMMPSSANPKPVTNVPAANCTYTASPAPNTATSNATVGGNTSPSVTATHASDTATNCGINTTLNGTGQFNDEWLHIRIRVPSNYTCTAGINPETTANSCWWGIKYTFSAGAAHDVTTWKAHIEGNPVHLIQ